MAEKLNIIASLLQAYRETGNARFLARANKLQQSLTKWDRENYRVKATGSKIATAMSKQYNQEYEEMKAMLLKLDGKKEGNK